MTCSAYRDHQGVCSNGFIQTIYCRQEVKCHACGATSERVPHCMRDDLPQHWLTESGGPVFYRPTPRELAKDAT